MIYPIFKSLALLLLLECFLFVQGFYVSNLNETELVLDKTTTITPIIDNEEYFKDAYVRTLKVKYKDLNRNKNNRINDSTYYRCAHETRVIFYSPFDSLVLNSQSRKSCDITAFFDLETKEKEWMIKNYIYYIKIINMNTKYELILDNPQPRYLSNFFFKYKGK